MGLEGVAIGLVALLAVLGLRRFQLRGAYDMEVDGARFVPIGDGAALKEFLATPNPKPGVLFLHDPGCPISAGARREMVRLGGEIPMVNVRQDSDISRAVEAATGIRHESPQVIVFAQGRATWSASHFAITAAEVRGALAAAPIDDEPPREIDRDAISGAG
jgi:bacillithiol system protein YtxJ